MKSRENAIVELGQVSDAAELGVPPELALEEAKLGDTVTQIVLALPGGLLLRQRHGWVPTASRQQ